jgi:glyoxylase-like metal-dependent hydrolase (beta-lactamase superfamily II)
VTRVLAAGGTTVHRLGDPLVNFYVVDTGAGLVLVDAGLPGHWQHLRGALHGMGHDVSDVSDVLITHGHLDHIGLAERVRVASGARIWVHEADAPILRSPLRASLAWRPERSLAGYAVRRPASLRAPLHLVGLGALRTSSVGELITFGHDQALDVPGSPRAVPVAGHTAGSTAFVFPDASLAFTGDALVTLDSVVGHVGPCLICRAFTENSSTALTSLSTLAELDVQTVLPGHGEPWTDGMAAAAAAARTIGSR